MSCGCNILFMIYGIRNSIKVMVRIIIIVSIVVIYRDSKVRCW